MADPPPPGVHGAVADAATPDFAISSKAVRRRKKPDIVSMRGNCRFPVAVASRKYFPDTSGQRKDLMFKVIV